MQCKPAHSHVYSVLNMCKVFCWEIIANEKHVTWWKKLHSTGKRGRNPESAIAGVIILHLVVEKHSIHCELKLVPGPYILECVLVYLLL